MLLPGASHPQLGVMHCGAGQKGEALVLRLVDLMRSAAARHEY